MGRRKNHPKYVCHQGSTREGGQYRRDPQEEDYRPTYQHPDASHRVDSTLGDGTKASFLVASARTSA
jgi:hypothetical protein